MKRITETIYPTGTSHREIIAIMREWHLQHPFKNGVNLEQEYFWAILEDDDCLAFCLKYPQYQSRFKDV